MMKKVDKNMTVKKDNLVLYAYTYQWSIDRVKDGREKSIAVKFGDTTQGLEDGLSIDESGKVRISQQGDASEAYKKIIIGTWGVPKELISRDYDIHKKWKAQGLRPKDLDGKGNEWFYLGNTLEKVKDKIAETIVSFGADSDIKLKLRLEQQRTLDEAIEIFNSTDSDRVDIAANLPPRFGKTTWALSLFNELDKKVLVLPSAWLSTHTSFEDDIKVFRDFNDIVYIETANNPDYYKDISKALNEGKRVAVTVSLFAKDKNQFNVIRNIPNADKLVCIDEGDFAAWTSKKRDTLEYLVSKQNTGKVGVITMSGTNIARMVHGSENIDGVVQSTYMSLEKTEKNIVKRAAVKLKLSDTDKYVKEFTENDYFSYNKAMADPMKSKNFWSLFVKGLTGNTENPAYKNLNLSTMMNNTFDCGMMFVSGTNKNIKSLKDIIEKAIPEWTIIVVNGDYTSNNKAKDDVRRQIEWSKQENKEGVLILANSMGSRSFSIPEIQASIIAYDKGGIDPTIQKISRCLTPGKMLNGEIKETGYIVTCSMDSNRDSTMIQVLTEEAAIQSNISNEPLPKITKQLLNNVSILTTDEYGNKVELTHDDLIEEMSSSQTLSKVAFALSKPQNILHDEDMLDSFLSINLGKNKSNKKDNKQLPNTKNFISDGKRPSKAKEKNILNKVMKKIEMLCDTSSMVAALAKGNTYRECLNNIDGDKFERRFGIDKEYVIMALDKNILPEKLLDAVVASTSNVIKSGDINKFHELETIGEFPELGIVKSTEKELWTETLKAFNLENKKIASLGTNFGKEVAALIDFGLPKENITVIDKSGFPDVWNAAGVNVIEKSIEEVEMNFKPDVTIANPPYVGKAQLHQKFFNKAVEMTKDGGVVIFLQPATPYQNQKQPRKHEAKMMENVLEYKTDVKILDSNIFKGADIGNDLAVTVLHKVKNTSGKLNSITYKDGNKYENVSLEDISMTGISPDVFSKIKSKYENYTTNNGSLQDKTYYKLNSPKNNIAGLPKIRGHMGSSDMYTFQPTDVSNTKYYTTDISKKHDFGIEVKNNKEIRNVYSYLTTYVARFGLAILKNNPNNHMGEFAKVPLVDFNKKWTDEMLIKELKLTEKEMKVIINTVGNYHG